MLMQQQDPAVIVLWRVMGSGSGTGRVVWEAGTPGMGNGLLLARVAGQGLKEVRNDWLIMTVTFVLNVLHSSAPRYTSTTHTCSYTLSHSLIQDKVEVGRSHRGTQCVWPRFPLTD